MPAVLAKPDADVSAVEVADMFAQITRASAEFARQLDLIATAPHPLSQVTVDALTRMLAMLAPAARARQQMALLPPALLMAGIQVWLGRGTPTGRESAQDRANRAWLAGSSR